MRYEDIELGRKLELVVTTRNPEHPKLSLASKLIGLENSKLAVIDAPIHEGNIYPIHLDTQIEIYFNQKQDLYLVEAKVLSRKHENNIPLIQIEFTSDVQKVQRREYFRFPVSLGIKYRVIDPSQPQALQQEYQEGMTRNLSGGGASILIREAVDLGTMLECLLPLGQGQEVFIHGKAVRVSKRNDGGKYKCEVGIRFKGIERKDRESIISYIFEEQRRLIKKGLR